MFNLGVRRPAASEERTVSPAGRADGTTTRAAILRAARDRLVEVGYANLNVRDIAREAGVNHALIGYHFHGKQQLVLAVLDEANKQLLERQTRMYQGTPSAGRAVAAGVRLLRARPEVGLRPPADGADGGELPRPGAAPGVRAAPVGLAPAGRGRGGRVHRQVEARAAGVGRGDRGLDRLVLDRHGGQHDARHRREGGPPARGARGGGDAAAPGRRARTKKPARRRRK